MPEETLITDAEEVGINVISYDSLLKGPEPEVEVRVPNRQSLMTICYTSGTTGNPKGVMITHNSLIVSLEACDSRFISLFPNDIYLSYLPLAHMMERMCTNGLMAHGGRIGFFGGDIQKLRDDL